MPSVKEMILSEEYADLILPVYTGFLEDYKEYGARIFNEYYGIIHYPLAEEFFQNYYDYGFFYNNLPHWICWEIVFLFCAVIFQFT